MMEVCSEMIEWIKKHNILSLTFSHKGHYYIFYDDGNVYRGVLFDRYDELTRINFYKYLLSIEDIVEYLLSISQDIVCYDVIIDLISKDIQEIRTHNNNMFTVGYFDSGFHWYLFSIQLTGSYKRIVVDPLLLDRELIYKVISSIIMS